MNRILLVLLMVGVSVWIGCGRSRKVTGPDGSETTVTTKGDNVEVTFKGAKGETVQVAGGKGNVPLPEGFPDDVPVYPGAKVMTSAKTKEGMTLVLTTSDPLQKAMEFYQGKLKTNGWDIQNTMNMPDGGMLSGTKEKRTCTLVVNHSNDQTIITISVSEKETQ